MAKRTLAGILVLASTVGLPTAAVVSAQARDGESALLRELVGEVRALRAAIERYAETQLQTQTITGVMDVQQRRIAEANARLDALRRESGEAAQRVNQLAQELGAAERLAEHAFVKAGVTLDDSRREVEGVRAHARTQFEINSIRLQELRSRESELLGQLAAEEAKWNELLGRLDQWLRRP